MPQSLHNPSTTPPQLSGWRPTLACPCPATPQSQSQTINRPSPPATNHLCISSLPPNQPSVNFYHKRSFTPRSLHKTSFVQRSLTKYPTLTDVTQPPAAYRDQPKTKMASTTTSQKPITTSDSKPEDPQQKPTAALEEDDEFEDFPVDDWEAEETEAAAGGTGTNTQHLWEESWDDDDTSDDFSNQLKEELKKVEAARKR